MNPRNLPCAENERQRLTDALPICPLSLNLITELTQPVVALDNYIYEKKELESALEVTQMTSPMTRQPLRKDQLQEHLALKQLIHCYNDLQTQYLGSLEANQQLQGKVLSLKTKRKSLKIALKAGKHKIEELTEANTKLGEAQKIPNTVLVKASCNNESHNFGSPSNFFYRNNTFNNHPKKKQKRGEFQPDSTIQVQKK